MGAGCGKGRAGGGATGDSEPDRAVETPWSWPIERCGKQCMGRFCRERTFCITAIPRLVSDQTICMSDRTQTMLVIETYEGEPEPS